MPLNPLRHDPSQTTGLRREFMTQMRRRFNLLKKEITQLLVQEDVFGLKQLKPFNPLALNTRWQFESDSKKVGLFRDWLKERVDANILSVDASFADKPWTADYVDSAYRRGVARGYTQAHALDLTKPAGFVDGSKSQFLSQAFASQESLRSLERLGLRAFTNLQGITDQMSQQLTTHLLDGLGNGDSPFTIATRMKREISGLTKRRALTLARTEIVRAQAEGQLDAFERVGARDVVVMAEWSTAGDDRVCEKCLSLEGVVMPIKTARGILPRHPNCRCAYIPAGIGEGPIKGQVLGQDAAVARFGRSIRAEIPKAKTLKDARKKSKWLGADRKAADFKAPKSPSPIPKPPVPTKKPKVPKPRPPAPAGKTAKEIADEAKKKIAKEIADKRLAREALEKATKKKVSVAKPTPAAPKSTDPGLSDTARKFLAAKEKKAAAREATKIEKAAIKAAKDKRSKELGVKIPNHITYSGEITDFTKKIYKALKGTTVKNEVHAREIGKLIQTESAKRSKKYATQAKKQLDDILKKEKDLTRKIETELDRLGNPSEDALWKMPADKRAKFGSLEEELGEVQELVDELLGGEAYAHRQATREVLREVRDFGGHNKAAYVKAGTSQEAVEMIELAADEMPKDWMNLVFDRQKIKAKRKIRGYHISRGKTTELAISGYGDRAHSTAVHELTHAVEERMSKMGKLQAEFLKRRVKGAQKTRIYADKHEYGWEDDFLEHYSGKSMGGKTHFEVMTTGVEDVLPKVRSDHTMNRFGVGFSQESSYSKGTDKDYQSFILGMIVGL